MGGVKTCGNREYGGRGAFSGGVPRSSTSTASVNMMYSNAGCGREGSFAGRLIRAMNR